MSCSPHPAHPAMSSLHGKGARQRKIRRICASAAVPTIDDVSTTTTLPYVDTHCHLDLIFEKLNTRSVSDKKKDVSGMPAPGSVHHASWLTAVRDLESKFVMQSGMTKNKDGVYESTGTSTTVSPKLEACLTVACSAKAQQRIKTLLVDATETPQGVFAAFGCHPLSAGDWWDTDFDIAKNTKDLLLRNERVAAVGECGLDYYYQPSGGVINGSGEAEKEEELDSSERDRRKLQAKTFIAQMELSNELNVPIVVHTREAETDTLRLMKQHLRRDAKVHVHCFTSAKWFAEELLQHFPNLCLGFTGVVTFKNAHEVREVVKVTPLNRLLLETDGPYMAPVPKRGEVAHPGHVPFIAAKIAEVKEVSVEEVLVAARDATRRTYGI